MTPLRLLDLFSGIGGFSLGLERSGAFQTVAFCEIEPFARAVLRKHWPETPIYDDVRTLTASGLATDGIRVDAICGGFPCQDISLAGKGAGLAGERSGLWFEFNRLIEEIRPQVAIIENVPALRSRGLDEVLRCLAAIGYDAEWHCIPASAVGACHRRDRVWIVANSRGGRRRGSGCGEMEQPRRAEIIGSSQASTNANSGGWRVEGNECQETSGARSGQSVCDGEACLVADASRPRLAFGQGDGNGSRSFADAARSDWWAVEPDVGRVVDGVSDKVDRRKRLICLGNSVVPQIPEIIGRAILEAT